MSLLVKPTVDDATARRFVVNRPSSAKVDGGRGNLNARQVSQEKSQGVLA